jgi:hypothetical protein
VLRCYDLGPMQNPFSIWSILELERGLGLRYQVIADIEELLRERSQSLRTSTRRICKKREIARR